jgi:hypothetical protein
MNRGITRFIPIIFIIVIVFLAVAAIVSVVRIIATSSQAPQETQQVDASSQALLDTSADRSVRMTVRGPIVADDNFRSYQVTVSPSKREFTRYRGYLDTPLVTKTYENNAKAYDEFVHALSIAGLAKGEPLTGEDDDTRGICAGGAVYEFEIINGAHVVERLWTTSCQNIKGSLVADAGQVQQLFLSQIPDANAYIGKD